MSLVSNIVVVICIGLYLLFLTHAPCCACKVVTFLVTVLGNWCMLARSILLYARDLTLVV
jgi:hypothetical protein